MQHETVIVVAGGQATLAPTVALPPGSPVIAADGGVDLALALGLEVDVAIGDFDSVTDAGLAAVEAAGARIERHPAAKDATDLELALDAALALDPARLVVVGSDGGRLDHLLGVTMLLAAERYAGVEVEAHLGPATAYVVRRARELAGAPGELVSLVPVHGPAEGVTTEGLAFPLTRETLAAGTTRGISNVFAAARARIDLERGCLLVIRPGVPDSGESS